MQANKKCEREPCVIDAAGIYYKELNRRIRELSDAGVPHLVLTHVRGQRYIGDGITNQNLLIEIEGVPGEDLGYGMGGPTIIVHGPGQNAIANTMDSGKIIVHGLAGDALAYGMRGGKLFVRDDVGYRVGIHMKAYKDKSPTVVVGGAAGDFLGEYMAGGTLILLNRTNEQQLVCGASDRTLATGIHGGEVYIFGYEVPSHLLGIGASLIDAPDEDKRKIAPFIREFAADFGLPAAPLMSRQVVKIVPIGTRPFAKFYSSSYPVNTALKPEKKERTSPCEYACPAGVPTSRFLRALRQGEVAKALELLDDVTPFRYSCCGFVCPHLCVQGCTRAKLDFPVRTAELAKRYRVDLPAKKVGDFSGKIAVVGAGPAGLTAAYHLGRMGYEVTIYDGADRPGGKMYQVISRTRLPLEDLAHDLKRIEDLGVKMVSNTWVDAEKFEAILGESDYVIVAAGAHRGVVPEVKGKKHITPGIDFLKAAQRGEKLDLGTRLLCIGAGDAALDGIEAALHLGVLPQDIVVIDIKTPSGTREEIRKFEAQGVRFRFPVSLQAVAKGSVTLENETAGLETIPADTVIAFINEYPQLDFLPEEAKKDLDARGFFSPAGATRSFRTSHPKISIVGDANSLGLVTTNIGRARECAREVHALLQGEAYQPVVPDPIPQRELHPERFLSADPSLPIEQECARCLHCGICVQCDECVRACPRGALRREGEEFSVDLTLCGGCGTCAAACPGGVLRMVPR